MVYLLLYIAAVILILSVIGYLYASKLNKQNSSRLKKEQKSELKRKRTIYRTTSHILLGSSLLLGLIFLVQYYGNKYNFESLNYNVPIEVTTDKDYGQGHSENPVKYEMKIPTSGEHSPHDLKFGYYSEKPPYEKLVHNLEHGDVIIYFHPDATPELKEKLKYFTHFRTAGSGILVVPNPDVPADKEIVATAWTKTMALTTFDQEKIGAFIYQNMNKAPEKIAPEVRLNGGTM